jgi:hypothetical protein
MFYKFAYKFLIFLALFILQKVHGQSCGLALENIRAPKYFNQKNKKNTIENFGFYRLKNTELFNQRDSFYLNQFARFKAPPSVPNVFGMSLNAIFSPVSFVFSVNNLPFFCKLEYNLGVEKKYPLKIRLGDVHYVDELEGKKNGNLP